MQFWHLRSVGSLTLSCQLCIRSFRCESGALELYDVSCGSEQARGKRQELRWTDECGPVDGFAPTDQQARVEKVVSVAFRYSRFTIHVHDS